MEPMQNGETEIQELIGLELLKYVLRKSLKSALIGLFLSVDSIINLTLHKSQNIPWNFLFQINLFTQATFILGHGEFHPGICIPTTNLTRECLILKLSSGQREFLSFWVSSEITIEMCHGNT